MSRRRPDSGPAISLFPFLAVLLCTMGSLLVLLVLFSRRAGDSRTVAAEAAARARTDALALDRDELTWRLEQLSGIRDRTAAELARARMQLAGIEEDSRRLADELDAMEREAAALADRRPAAEPAATEQALADLERRLAEDREALARARAEGAGRPAYAVVPYEGSNGTRRRPLYIECCIDGVFLQPEGIRLGPADFEGPPGPGNPLASALRAAREHVARQPGESGAPEAQPYPLLLVRPSGVMAYYAAREAIQSWGNEFGYQFIDEDWPLTFPPADPALAAVEQRAIDESRRRLAWLAQSRPPRASRASRPPQLYRAAPTRGGVVADGGPSVLGDQSRFDWTEESASAGRDGGGPGGAGGEAGASGDVILGGVGRAGEVARGGDAGGRYAGPSRFYAAAPSGPGAGGDGSGPGDGGAPGAALPGSPTGTGGPARTGSRFGAARDGGAAPGGGDGSVAGAVAGTASGGGGQATGGDAGGGGQAGTGGQAGAAGQSGGGGAGPSMPGLASAGGGGMTGQTGGADSGATVSLAGARGSNWASLATAERPIPLTRPIRIECTAREFRMLDDAGGRVQQRIPIGTETVTAIDPLVQSVHARVAGWGLAGHRMYWKPELILSETPDGAGRRAELERLLADSGLDTRRRDAGDVVRGLPPVERTSGLVPSRR
jgi:hypothetical protein